MRERLLDKWSWGGTKMLTHLRRFICLFLALMFTTLAMGCASSKPDRVLLILRERSDDMEYMLINEVDVMTKMLEKAGYKVETASVSGEPISAGKTTITPDFKLADVKIKDYAGFIFPCMAVPMDETIASQLLDFAKSAAATGKPIAAQTGGVQILYEAGLLNGKQIGIFNMMEEMFPKSLIKGEGVVQDGNIITSGICPYLAREFGKTDGTTELTQKLIDALASAS
jgi:putative intracellular protease/amidase